MIFAENIRNFLLGNLFIDEGMKMRILRGANK
jgi:hypothetical protein